MHKIPSIYSVLDGPLRWRIQIEFDPQLPGHVAIGMAATSDRKSGEHDVMISPAQSPMPAYSQRIAISIWKAPRWVYRDRLASRAIKSVVLVELDIKRRLLCVDSEGIVGEPMRRTVLPVGVSIIIPCIFVSGAVTVSLIPWPSVSPSDGFCDCVCTEPLVITDTGNSYSLAYGMLV
jgi:hypothetical protein